MLPFFCEKNESVSNMSAVCRDFGQRSESKTFLMKSGSR